MRRQTSCCADGHVSSSVLTPPALPDRARVEAMRTQISTVDEQYTYLPARVTRLEATVFAPERR